MKFNLEAMDDKGERVFHAKNMTGSQIKGLLSNTIWNYKVEASGDNPHATGTAVGQPSRYTGEVLEGFDKARATLLGSKTQSRRS